ncbi:MAG: ABC transporter substrate-binding protein [Bacteroidetes bacterium]|nr:ABC transporter substrate-binding protein [Bacteroidota bacterium]
MFHRYTYIYQLLSLTLCGLMGLLLQSCGEGRQPFDPQVFHYNQAAGIASLDPAFARDQSGIWACDALYNGLVQLDDSLQVRPCIAYRWDISDSGRTYIFHLRGDVVFHGDSCFHGQERHATAYDVLYSLSRIADPHTASPGAWIFHDRVDSVQPFEVRDDSTFVLHLLRPFRPMLGILTMQYCSVIPREAVEMYGPDFRSHPVGTGPFYLKVWREGSAMILARNEKYFEFENGERLPHIKGVRVSFIGNKKTEFVAFKQGKLDLISGIDASFQDEVLDENGALKKDLADHYDLSKVPYLNTEYLGFLMTGDSTLPLHDVRVRQAINYGFDRSELIRYLRNGIGRPAEQGFTPPGLPSFDAEIKGYHYDAQKAQSLLNRAGYGKKTLSLTLYTNDTYKEMALMLSKQLEKVNIRLKVEVTEPAILRQRMSQGQVAFFRGSWIADYPDAESYFTVFYSGNTAPPNYTRFHNAEYDHIYERSLAENNDSLRYALYHQLERIIIKEAPIVPLYYDEVLRFTQKRVKGLRPNGLNLLDLKRVRLE